MNIKSDFVFPFQEINQQYCNTDLSVGLSKREHYASLAVIGIIAGLPKSSVVNRHNIAAEAVRQADALIQALKEMEINTGPKQEPKSK